MSAKISPSSLVSISMDTILAKLQAMEKGLDQHKDEIRSLRDQYTSEMKSLRNKHAEEINSLQTELNFLKTKIQNGDLFAKTGKFDSECILQKPPHKNEEQLNTSNWVHKRLLEVEGGDEKHDVQVHDDSDVSSDADRAHMGTHDVKRNSKQTDVSDTDNDEIMRQLERKFASEETKRSMTSINVTTYLAYPGYSEETPISPAQSCCSTTWVICLTLLVLLASLLTILQRAFCDPLLLAMSGSGSWYGLEFQESYFGYDTSSQIEELARQNLTIDQHVDGSYLSLDTCLLNLRPMSGVSYLVLTMALVVFNHQHGHLVGPQKLIRLFCDNGPRVAHVRWVFITAYCTQIVCGLCMTINAVSMADWLWVSWILIFLLAPMSNAPMKTYQPIWHRFFQAMVATMLPTFVFLLSCTFRSWAALRHSFADILSAAVETGISNYTKTSLVEATARLPPAFYETQDWFATACALGWLMPMALFCCSTYTRVLVSASFVPNLKAIFKFELGITDFGLFIIWPLILFLPQFARVFHHGGVLTVYPVQFFLTIFGDCVVAGGEVWCGEAVDWSTTRALELLTGAGTTSYLDPRLWSNWVFLVVIFGPSGFYFIVAIPIDSIKSALRKRLKAEVTEAVDTFWRHRRRFTSPKDFLPISKELGARMLRTTRLHCHVSYLHSLQGRHFRPLKMTFGGTIKSHFSHPKSIKENDNFRGRTIHRPSLALVARYLIRRVHEAKAPESKRVLRLVVNALRAPHKSIYDATMIGIKQQPLYRDLIGLATRVQDELDTLYGVGFKPRQYDPTRGVGAETFRELYNGGIAALKKYEPMLRTLGEKTGGGAKVAPMKGFWRVLEKLFVVPGITDRWERDAPVSPEDVDAAVQSLAPADIVRGWIEFEHVSQMKLALGLLVGADDRLRGLEGAVDSHTVGLGFNLEILRIKNRFNQPTDAGWADMLVNFRFRPNRNEEPEDYPEQGDNPYWHVCEIQLVHEQMSLVRKQMGAHHMYSKFRSAMELLEALGEQI